VDLERFRPRAAAAASTLRLLAIGRLVEKKGFDVLIDAVARTRLATLRIVGDGPLWTALHDRIAARGAADRITLTGPRTHRELPDEYANAHAVVVPSVVDASGDRDGLPNVVLEAMASGRAVLATSVGAITAAVRDGDTGLVVAPRNVDALQGAIEAMAARPEWPAVMGARARRVVEREFDVRQCAGVFAGLLETAYA
jgi:glycosyltransferase involved in cell wall biosynthesis